MKVILKKGPLFEQAEAKAYKYLRGILVQRMNEHQEKLAQQNKKESA
ncbi:hypothetical protein V7728_06240 [Bacillus sp. JHAA]|uniref:Fur-regulated basic protein FbpA n=1 Tax=Bacillus cabrialesii subsp. tritici TaxID=2944916 RepID=A0ABT9DMI7_9BACI|nr:MULTISPECIES: hypothetical protein [Bacillus]MCY8205284.1 hypothetical protein [Bacillus sp. N12A5]POO76755.1 hypothetical protein C1T30_41110 [Bacillus sp. MBGLi97]AUZ39576.1 hypothetical protein C1T29_15335 [Bacillus sp. MBGLi79]MCY7807110.1 hypothetical protein [Bacillus spizizenii]MCY7821194.1 hypothetical protein [Bacillus inaquosorum]